MNELDTIAETIRAEFETKTAARDDALAQSRLLVRYCADTIKSIHRADWEAAQAGLERAKEAARGLTASVADYPDLYYAGYTQDALKELVEAFATYALVRDEELGKLALPTDATGLTEAEVEFYEQLNTMDGWPSTFQQKVEFTGTVADDTVTESTVQVWRWGTEPERETDVTIALHQAGT